MSTNITIRDIPDDLYKKIQEQAELHQRSIRSINSEIIFYLKQMVSSHRPDPDEVITRAKIIKSQAKGALTIQEIMQCIKQ